MFTCSSITILTGYTAYLSDLQVSLVSCDVTSQAPQLQHRSIIKSVNWHYAHKHLSDVDISIVSFMM